MSIILPADLALQTSSDPATLITAAQTAVEVYCFGEDGRLLANTVRTETFRPRLPTTLLQLQYGPVTALTSLLWNSVERKADALLLGLFGVRIPPALNGSALGFLPGDSISVSYTQGYASAATVPQVFKQAVALLASDPNFRPQGRGLSERALGDISVQFSSASLLAGGVTPPVAALLGPYRDPRLLGFQ